MARPTAGGATSSFEVLWNGVVVGTVIPADTGLWQTLFYTVMGTGGLDRLTVRELGNNDSLGALIDNVTLFVAQGGNDSLFAGAGNDVLQGGGGDDLLQGGAGNDTINGGIGFDTADYSDASAGVAVTLANQAQPQATGGGGTDQLSGIEALIGSDFNDMLSGDATPNSLLGREGSDIIDGGFGNDTLDGGDGNDSLAGGGGSDIIEGGAGFDTAFFTGNRSDYTINSSGGITTLIDIRGGSPEGTDTVSGVEDFQFADGVVALSSVNDIVGTPGDDSALTGGNEANVILGLDGSDLITGGGGADRIDAGDGKDFVDGGDGNDNIVGGANGDTLVGGNGVDFLNYYTDVTGVNVNLLTNAASAGDAQGDVISGFEGLAGGAANDTLTGDNGDNNIVGLTGSDTILGLGGDDVLSGDYTTDATGDGDDTIDGGLGDDTIYGRGGDDSLIGGTGNDSIDGGSGNDTLDGSDSTVIGLFGGSGNDLLMLDTAALEQAGTAASGGADYDTVVLRDNGSSNPVLEVGLDLVGKLDGIEKIDATGVNVKVDFTGSSAADIRSILGLSGPTGSGTLTLDLDGNDDFSAAGSEFFTQVANLTTFYSDAGLTNEIARVSVI
jgi:Ca2+-binding RTX toxin-like protein